MNQQQRRHLSKRIEAIADRKIQKHGHSVHNAGRPTRWVNQNSASSADLAEILNGFFDDWVKTIKFGSVDRLRKHLLSDCRPKKMNRYGGYRKFDGETTIPLSTVIDCKSLEKIINTCKQQLKAKDEENRKAVIAIETEKVRILDEIMLGDSEEALKMIKAFEAKEF